MQETEVLELLEKNELSELRRLCVNEIFMSKSKGDSAAKARTKLAEKVAKQMRRERPALAGAYMIDGEQMLCNAILGAVYKDVVEGLPVPEQGPGLDMWKVIPKAPKHLDDVDLNVDDLKKRLKVHKADPRGHDKKDAWLVKIDEAYYNAELLIDLASTFTGMEWNGGKLRVGRAQGYNVNPKYAMLVIEGENGSGVLCPINPKNKDGERVPPSAYDVIKDYNEKTEFWEESYYN